MTISNRYKDILDKLIDSSDIESSDRAHSPDWPGLIDKGSRNTLRSRDGSPTLSKEDCLDNNVFVMSLELVSIIRDS